MASKASTGVSATGWPKDPGDAPQGCRLSGPVRANEAEDLPGTDLEGKPLDRGEVPVHLLQTADLDDGRNFRWGQDVSPWNI